MPQSAHYFHLLLIEVGLEFTTGLILGGGCASRVTLSVICSLASWDLSKILMATCSPVTLWTPNLTLEKFISADQHKKDLAIGFFFFFYLEKCPWPMVGPRRYSPMLLPESLHIQPLAANALGCCCSSSSFTRCWGTSMATKKINISFSKKIVRKCVVVTFFPGNCNFSRKYQKSCYEIYLCVYISFLLRFDGSWDGV